MTTEAHSTLQPTFCQPTPGDETSGFPYTVENGAGERLTFVRRVEESGGDRLEVENLVAPEAGPPMHVHYLQEEALTVVEGRIGYQRPGEPAQFAGPGETVVFAAGEAHRFWNAGAGDLRCTGYVKPAGNLEYFLGALFASQRQNGGRRPGLFEAAFLARRYRTEFGMLEVPALVQRLVFPLLVAVGGALGKYAKYADAPEPSSDPMSGRPPQGVQVRWTGRDRAAHWLLFALAVVAGIQTGGVIFDTLVNDPVWSASVAAARGWNEAVDPSRFYIAFTNGLFLLAIVTLVVGWRSPRPVRGWLRCATGLFIIAVVTTIAYFLPEIQELRGAPAGPIPDGELSDRIRRWTLLDPAREALIIAGFVLTVHAVGLSHAARARIETLRQRSSLTSRK